MKKFDNIKDLARYLNVNSNYLDKELYNFLGCQGSEIFNCENDINIDAFKYEGLKINNKIVYIASVLIDTENERWKEIYCVEE